MKEDKLVFVDTNILLSASAEGREDSECCLTLLTSGLNGDLSLYSNAQVMREYLVVATRPTEVNGLGMTASRALDNVAEFRRCIQNLEESSDVLSQLLMLIKKHRLKGKRIHDANIAATMMVNGVSQLATFNKSDFKCFDGIGFWGF